MVAPPWHSVPRLEVPLRRLPGRREWARGWDPQVGPEWDAGAPGQASQHPLQGRAGRCQWSGTGSGPSPEDVGLGSIWLSTSSTASG
jgi:hypothetical protein